MNTEQLETLLRAKVETEPPRPGFETRIQALSREPYETKQKRSRRWLAVPTLAAVTFVLVLSKPKDDPGPAVVEAQDPVPVVEAQPEESLTFIEDTPVHREIEAVKSDAERTMSFLSRSLPSLSLTKQKKEKKEEK